MLDHNPNLQQSTCLARCAIKLVRRVERSGNWRTPLFLYLWYYIPTVFVLSLRPHYVTSINNNDERPPRQPFSNFVSACEQRVSYITLLACLLVCICITTIHVLWRMTGGLRLQGCGLFLFLYQHAFMYLVSIYASGESLAFMDNQHGQSFSWYCENVGPFSLCSVKSFRPGPVNTPVSQVVHSAMVG